MTASLTVIVPAHNEQEGLPATLESLLRQTEPPERFKVGKLFHTFTWSPPNVRFPTRCYASTPGIMLSGASS